MDVDVSPADELPVPVDPFLGEPDLLHHPPRRLVEREHLRPDAVETLLVEAVADEQPDGLGRVAPSLEIGVHPVADLRGAGASIDVREPDGAGRLAVDTGEQVDVVVLGDALDPVLLLVAGDRLAQSEAAPDPRVVDRLLEEPGVLLLDGAEVDPVATEERGAGHGRGFEFPLLFPAHKARKFYIN